MTKAWPRRQQTRYIYTQRKDRHEIKKDKRPEPCGGVISYRPEQGQGETEGGRSHWLKPFACASFFYQGQEEERFLRFRGRPHRSGGPLQERHVNPQLQGDPENQRQEEGQIGAGNFMFLVLFSFFVYSSMLITVDKEYLYL